MKRIYTFTDAELQELVNDDTSKVFIKKSVFHISLHAYHFADLKQSLCEIFDDSINHFKSELGGIVLSYRNIKVLSRIGTIINDDSRIYIDVQADFYVFSPHVGSVLTGIVNKKSNDHVGCLVHKLFNVSIPRPPEEDAWNGETVEIGQKVSFRVEFMDFDLNLPYIRGKLVDSSLHPGLTEQPVKKKKKKKKNKDTLKDEDKPLDNQPAEAKNNLGGDEQKESTEQQQNTKKKKKKDKKIKKHAENLNQDEPLLINAQDIGESEHLSEPLEDRLTCKSSGEALTECIDLNFSRDFSDISMLACSTQKEEVPPKKKKKKKAKEKEKEDVDNVNVKEDVDNVNVQDTNNTVDSSKISQELMNSSHRQELLDVGKKKKKLFTNGEDLLIENSEDVLQEPAPKKKSKKHNKHKQHSADAESGENPLQNNKPEECEMTAKSPTNTLSEVQQSKTSYVGPGKTKKQGSSDLYWRNSRVMMNISNEDAHVEAAISKEKDNQDSSAVLQSLMDKAGKNLNTAVNSSTDSSKPEKTKKRRLSEAELDEIPSPKKKKSIRFSTEVEMIVQDDVQADSEYTGVEHNEERMSNIKELESQSDVPSSISGASVTSPFNNSIYSGASMVNSLDRKRKKKVKANEDVAALKRPFSNISPSLISSTRALFQNFSEPNIKDPPVIGLASSSNLEEIKEQSFQGIHSPQSKSGSERDSVSSSPSKPLTQREIVSHHSRTAAGETLNALDASISEGFNSTINAFEPLDISHLIARLNSSENADAQKQKETFKSPKSDKEKKKKRKKKEERISKDSQAENHTTTDTGEKLNENVGVDFNKINTAELSSISELIARLNSENTAAEKQELSPKSPKADKDKKNKTEVKEASTKSKHKTHKKHKKNKDEKKEDKSKKEKDKKKTEPKSNMEKKKTKKESDLTDLSRKLLQDFLKKQHVTKSGAETVL